MKKNLKLFIGFGISAFILITVIITLGLSKHSSLNDNLQYSKAIVVDHFYTIRFTDYFSYEFFVDSKKHRGSGQYYTKSELLSSGDTVLIVYDQTNPENNKTKRDFERSSVELPYILIFIPFLFFLLYWRYRDK